MSAPLREQIQMARINRMKRRAATAWHRAHCAECQARAAGVPDASGLGLAQLLQQLGAAGVEVHVIGGDDDTDGAHPVPPSQAH